MEDNGLGSVIFYIILAVIALAGSFQNKKKKVPPKQAVPRKACPEDLSAVQHGHRRWYNRHVRRSTRRPQYIPHEPVDEGNYAEPMARYLCLEKARLKTAGQAHLHEGSVSKGMAGDFARKAP